MNQSVQNMQQNYSSMAAVALILIGGIFLLRNFDIIDLGHNWWALFMLIPISYTLASAWRRRQESSKLSSQARRALVSSAVLIVVMCIFLFNLNWGTLWPVFLILGGLSIVFGARS